MVISHNLAAMNAQRQFGINTNNKSKTAEKLSSGYRINRAADDAAGLSISEKMRKQIRGLSQASENAEEGISLVQVADGAMNEIHAMLQRGNELCVQAANGTLSDDDRASIQAEMEELEKEINALADRTKFNEIIVLKGKGDEKVEVSPGNAIIKGGFPSWATVSGIDQDGYMSGSYITTETFRESNGTTTTDTQYSISHVSSTIDFSQYDGSDDMKKELLGQGFYTTCCTCDRHYSVRFTTGTGNSMEESGRHYIFNIGIDNITTGEELVDAIIAGTTTGVNSGQPLDHYTIFGKDAANSAQLVVYEIRSNQSDPTSRISGEWIGWGNSDDTVFNIQARRREGRGTFGLGVAIDGQDFEQVREAVGLRLQVGAEAQDGFEMELPEISSVALGIDTVDISTQEGALLGISLLDKAIGYVSGERSRMGAYQNRLEHIVKNLDNVVENTTAAESRIRDVDMAEEMVELSKQNILEQAGFSMMAQANQSLQGVLSLLQ